MDKNQTNDPGNQPYKHKRFIEIERIQNEIESRSGQSIESLRKSCRDEAHFYAKCLLFVAATNKAISVAIGINPKDGRKYAKALLLKGGLYKVKLVQCPVTNGRDYLMTTDPRKAYYLKHDIPIPHSKPL